MPPSRPIVLCVLEFSVLGWNSAHLGMQRRNLFKAFYRLQTSLKGTVVGWWLPPASLGGCPGKHGAAAWVYSSVASPKAAGSSVFTLARRWTAFLRVCFLILLTYDSESHTGVSVWRSLAKPRYSDWVSKFSKFSPVDLLELFIEKTLVMKLLWSEIVEIDCLFLFSVQINL